MVEVFAGVGVLALIGGVVWVVATLRHCQTMVEGLSKDRAVTFERLAEIELFKSQFVLIEMEEGEDGK
jgi:hypothetical protein